MEKLIFEYKGKNEAKNQSFGVVLALAIIGAVIVGVNIFLTAAGENLGNIDDTMNPIGWAAIIIFGGWSVYLYLRSQSTIRFFMDTQTRHVKVVVEDWKKNQKLIEMPFDIDYWWSRHIVQHRYGSRENVALTMEIKQNGDLVAAVVEQLPIGRTAPTSWRQESHHHGGKKTVNVKGLVELVRKLRPVIMARTEAQTSKVQAQKPDNQTLAGKLAALRQDVPGNEQYASSTAVVTAIRNILTLGEAERVSVEEKEQLASQVMDFAEFVWKGYETPGEVAQILEMARGLTNDTAKIEMIGAKIGELADVEEKLKEVQVDRGIHESKMKNKQAWMIIIAIGLIFLLMLRFCTAMS